MDVKFSDFLHLADGQDLSPAANAAVRALGDGDTLLLDPGVYHFYPDKAEILNYFISNNDPGDKPTAFPLVGKNHITIDGQGSELIFHGRILPFVADRSSDITIKNLSIDYSSTFYAQAEILEADRYKTVLRFSEDSPCEVAPDKRFDFRSNDGWEDIVESPLTLEFERNAVNGVVYPSPYKPPYFPYTGEKKDHGFLGGMFKDVMLEKTGDRIITMHGNLGFVHTPGNFVVMTHSSREFPGIFINDSKNVRLEAIRLYHTASMGIIAQLSENLTLDRVVAEPRLGSGRVLSVNADATHFVNCRGKIEMTGCKFVSMMDDAANIHGIYAICRRIEAPDTLICGFGHIQQRGINLCRPGDRIAIIDSDVTETVETRTVVSSELLNPDELCLKLDSPIPPLGEHFLVENLSTAPEVHISDCESGNNRPRGFLLSSAGKTVVERCKFHNMNCGIQIGGEMKDWYESGAVSDVLIRDCDFDNSAYAGGTAITICPQLREQNPRDFFHGRIVIENNRFVQSSKRVLTAKLTRELVFRNNSFILNRSLPYHPANGETGVLVTNCGRIDIDELK